MTISLRKCLVFLLFLTFTFGCKVFDQIQKKIEEDKKPKVITSSDGMSQLTVPGSWAPRTDLNDDATIQVANPRAEQYTVVISEPKADFTDELGLSGFAEIVRKGLSDSIPSAIVTENRPVTINGYPAIQFEVSGSVDNVRARWFYTLIDAPKNYHQVIAWTLNSKYEANKPVLLEVASSFKENDGSTTLPPPPGKP